MDFYSAMEARRSIRLLSKEPVISSERLEEVVSHALKFTPTAFNAQEQRLILLLDEKHDWFWNLLKAKLKAIVPADRFPSTEAKLNGFLSGVGTILLYQDTAVIEGLQEKFPTYKDNFPTWAHQASGMLKYTLWTSLTVEGYGASLQHYTELIEEEVQSALGTDRTWKMVGQIPFGKAAESPEADRAFVPLAQRMRVIK